MKSTISMATWGMAAAFTILLTSMPAFAGVGVSAAPTYPGVLDVGDANVAATLRIKNGSDGAEGTQQIAISNIQHTPACGSTTFPCPVGSRDPGVFDVNSPASGSEACAGMMFNVAIIDAATGTVRFTPQSGSVVLQPTGMANDACTINFTIDVLKVPTVDAGPTFGVMTNQFAAVSAQAVTSGTMGSGTGTNQTTVRALREVCEECLRDVPAVGISGMAALSVLLLGGGLGVMRRRRLAR